MSTQTIPVAAAAANIDPVQLVAALRAYRAQIPEYQQLTVAEARALRTAANVDPQLIENVILASTESDAMQSAIGMTPEVMRQETLDMTLWGAVEEELSLMTQGVATANLIRKHRLGLTALQAYSIGRQLVRKKEHANLLPHVANMKRQIKAGRKAVRPVTTTPAPNPPAPIPTAPPQPKPTPGSTEPEPKKSP